MIADFTKLTEVREAAKAILGRYERIDVLINSAGIHSTRRTFDRERHRDRVLCEPSGIVPFTRLLLDRLKESAPARIIQVNSQGHRFGGLSINDLNWKRAIQRAPEIWRVKSCAASHGLGTGGPAEGDWCHHQRDESR